MGTVVPLRRLDAGDASRLAQFLIGYLGALAANAAPVRVQSTS